LRVPGSGLSGESWCEVRRGLAVRKVMVMDTPHRYLVTVERVAGLPPVDETGNFWITGILQEIATCTPDGSLRIVAITQRDPNDPLNGLADPIAAVDVE
jgi:hypothetical protein